jgi:hypothetical protein
MNYLRAIYNDETIWEETPPEEAQQWLLLYLAFSGDTGARRTRQIGDLSISRDRCSSLG